VPAHGSLEVRFADGHVERVDLLPLLRGELLGRLADPRVFAHVAVDAESGVIVWSCGVDFDPGVLRRWREVGPAMIDLAAG
jgi:hypothetical protein